MTEDTVILHFDFCVFFHIHVTIFKQIPMFLVDKIYMVYDTVF